MYDMFYNNFNIIGYKSAGNAIIKLGINLDKDTKTNVHRPNCNNEDYAMFRTNKAFVIDIYDKDDYNKKYDMVRSDYRYTFKYITNQWVYDNKYDTTNDTVTCTTGIHFFLTVEPAFFWNKTIKNGMYKQWYPNGQAESIFNYRNGELH